MYSHILLGLFHSSIDAYMPLLMCILYQMVLKDFPLQAFFLRCDHIGGKVVHISLELHLLVSIDCYNIPLYLLITAIESYIVELMMLIHLFIGSKLRP